MHAVYEIGDCWLGDTNTLRKGRLCGLRALQILGKCLHRGRKDIGLPYTIAIRASYIGLAHTPCPMKPKERSFLSRALEALRESNPRRKPTQVRLAQIAGVTQPAVHEWGFPDRAPDHRAVVAIAKETGVCVEWLYTERGPKYPPKVAETDPFLQEWDQLDDETRKQLVHFKDFIRSRQRQ